MGLGLQMHPENLCHQLVLLVVTVLFLMLPIACKMCLLKGFLPGLHESYQSGNLVIGGIVSQIPSVFSEFSFKEFHFQELLEMAM